MILEIVLGVLVLIEGYGIWNLMRKTELLETWVEEFTQRIQIVQNDLNEIDSKGAFESDDETGTIFEQIKETVNQLDNLKGEDVDVN
tara:strand:- start:969 stop:1229 length:261 start_codon:yes stop_codon:yes gene_type:complete